MKENKTEELHLERPAPEHKARYEAMMEEWEGYGGRLNPGALRRYSPRKRQNVPYEEWIGWVEADRQAGQDLFFLLKGETLLGAISIRYRKKAQDTGTDGNSGYGIRPSMRRKGYAAKMLAMALPVMREYGLNPVVITCDKDNIASAKTILRNGGQLIGEQIDDETGKLVQIYYIVFPE